MFLLSEILEKDGSNLFSTWCNSTLDAYLAVQYSYVHSQAKHLYNNAIGPKVLSHQLHFLNGKLHSGALPGKDAHHHMMQELSNVLAPRRMTQQSGPRSDPPQRLSKTSRTLMSISMPLKVSYYCPNFKRAWPNMYLCHAIKTVNPSRRLSMQAGCLLA